MTIGNHKVQLGNVMNGIENLMGNDKADIFYSDMPWGQGNLNYWQTINLRQNKLAQEARQEVPYDAFVNKVFEIAFKYSKNIVFMEYGQKWREDIIKKGTDAGLIHLTVIETLYMSGSKKLPMDLHIFGKTDIKLPTGYSDTVYHTIGLNTLRAAVKPFIVPGGILLDPCCGMGYSAKISVDNGMYFRGNELNKSRLDKTIARLK